MGRIRVFTPVELLVVIAAIALLMAILMPGLHLVRRQAQTVGCRSNPHQWSLVFSMYAPDYEGRFTRHACLSAIKSIILGNMPIPL